MSTGCACDEASPKRAAPAGDEDEVLSVFILGASGDLAHKKTYPALYELWELGLLPANANFIGYARSKMDVAEFKRVVRSHLKVGTAERCDAFLERCTYVSGGYNDAAAFAKAVDIAKPSESGKRGNRMFYFAIPPTVFVDTAKTIHASGMSSTGWNRMVVEKPFGKDSETNAELNAELSKYFTEDQLYRIDHYLGKEMVQNLLVLRFANAVFEPLWNKDHIANVQITFKEPFGVEGRGGYFDGYGIIRDVMQNHLVQVLSLVAMEVPVSLSADDVHDEKVKVLRCTAPISLDDVVVGQYGANAAGSKPGYLDDPSVPKDSLTPTFATAVLHINNPRWRGVPFILKCGKALNDRKAEIRIQFKQPASSAFGCEAGTPMGVGQIGSMLSGSMCSHNNELVIRINPSEAVYLKMMCKMPGMDFAPVETELSLNYKTRYPCRHLPEAYARLILDVLRGDHSQFVRGDELAAAWEVFTPLLHRLERERIAPIIYPFGSRGPQASDKLIKKYGYVYESRYAGGWRVSEDPSASSAMLTGIREAFKLPTERLLQIVNAFIEDMRKGLRGDPVAAIRMLPAFVTGLPTGEEKGELWALDMGGSNLRVAKVELEGGGVLRMASEYKTVIPEAIMKSHATFLFDFVVDAMIRAGVPAGATLGFTFSFPVLQSAVDAGRLIAWTKGFSCAGATDHDIIDMLQDACKRKGVNVRVTALVNDTVGTLLASAYHDHACRMGIIFGTGTNACYMEKVSNITKLKSSLEGHMCVNMEWGNFGSNSLFGILPVSQVDDELDAQSPNEGAQRFEKMISGMYLGELSRLLLLHLCTAGAIFASPTGVDHDAVKALQTKDSLPSATMSAIADDNTAELTETARILREKMNIRSTLADRKLVQEMCHLVIRRAARLSAVGVAAVMMQMGTDGRGVKAGVDGSVFKHTPNFAQQVAEALSELDIHCKLVAADDGSGIGAALAALVSASGGALRVRED